MDTSSLPLLGTLCGLRYQGRPPWTIVPPRSSLPGLQTSVGPLGTSSDYFQFDTPSRLSAAGRQWMMPQIQGACPSLMVQRDECDPDLFGPRKLLKRMRINMWGKPSWVTLLHLHPSFDRRKSRSGVSFQNRDVPGEYMLEMTVPSTSLRSKKLRVASL